MSSPSALFPSGTPGVVARVAEHARKPGRYRVRLADGRQWLVDADGIAAAIAAARAGAAAADALDRGGAGLPALGGTLKEGAPIDEGTVLALEASHQFVACFDRAIGMLARARRTERELNQRLRRHEPDAAVIARVLERLATLGLLDDQAVARAEAASRFRRGEGAGRIRQSLRRKGVDGRVIDTAIREITEEEQVDDRALCRETAAKRLRSLAKLEPLVQRRRLIGFLLRRGFPGDVVSETVRALLPRGGWSED